MKKYHSFLTNLSNVSINSSAAIAWTPSKEYQPSQFVESLKTFAYIGTMMVVSVSVSFAVVLYAIAHFLG